MTTLPAPLPLTLADDDPPEAVRATPAPSSTRTAGAASVPAPTYSAYETLPDGRERRLVAGLRYTTDARASVRRADVGGGVEGRLKY
jgi:hypothetical protein